MQVLYRFFCLVQLSLSNCTADVIFAPKLTLDSNSPNVEIFHSACGKEERDRCDWDLSQFYEKILVATAVVAWHETKPVFVKTHSRAVSPVPKCRGFRTQQPGNNTSFLETASLSAATDAKSMLSYPTANPGGKPRQAADSHLFPGGPLTGRLMASRKLRVLREDQPPWIGKRELLREEPRRKACHRR